jgi:hypothetical protein
MSKPTDHPDKFEGETLKEAVVAYRADAPDDVYPLQTPEDKGWEDFRDQCRRQMDRSMENRIKYGFSRRIKPAPGGIVARSFNTMAEYRAWCEKNLPDYLGFKRPSK